MAAEGKARERHDGFSAERKQLFLTALRSGESVLDACALVGVSNRTAYNHRDRDPVFARDWGLAVRMHRAPLELAAYRRGVDGIEEPIYRHGKQVGTRRHYSDALLKLLLAGEKPRKYGRRAGLVADRKWLTKTIAAVIAPYKAGLDAALAEVAALKARAAEAAPPQIVKFVNPRPRRPKASAAPLRRENVRLEPAPRQAAGAPEISNFSRPQ
ncbi:MAG TPA: hypothetical protein VK614_12395 [Allosphingosinicella sp.]|nr:hypothetical protein [Allosphingosinicella sp.]